MKRKIRIIRIWYFGRVNLAKKIHIRRFYEALHKVAITNNSFYKYFTAKQFEEMCNTATRYYFASMILRK